MNATVLTQLVYLVSAILMILGLKRMSHPRRAVSGIIIAAGGLAIAVAITLMNPGISGYVFIALGLVIGTALGARLALTVQMTEMPQTVGLLNALGGGASTLVAWGELCLRESHPMDSLIAIAMSGLIGTVTFWGSLVAFAKLQEYQSFKKPVSFPQQKLCNLGLVVACGLLTIGMCNSSSGITQQICFILILIASTALGISLVMPIGGADMPVVISLMNSYSGLAGAATGFVIDNNALIIAGSLVGASGVILTQIMCKAMNRSLANVLFGGGEIVSGNDESDEIYATVRSTSADDVAMILDGAQRVVFVPGYGMAVAQAQHAVRDLSNLLTAQGAEVEYAIHPVAGRMPGHMNVLLAEADISYDQLKEMDEINPTLDTVDVAIVIGANDVVNPLARTDPQSPIAGMPIIDVDKCRTVIVIKRSLSPGFAGIANPLFALENTLMLYGDGQQAVLDIVKSMKENA